MSIAKAYGTIVKCPGNDGLQDVGEELIARGSEGRHEIYSTTLDTLVAGSRKATTEGFERR